MIELKTAFQLFEQHLKNRKIQIETIPVSDAAGHTLALDALANLDLPPFNRVAMDGYAVLSGDDCENYRILETVAAGDVSQNVLQPGTCIKIMTGAPAPENAGKIIPVEHVEEMGECIKVIQTSHSSHICLQGEDLAKGDTVARKGIRLTPPVLAAIISAGIQNVTVYKPVRVAIFSTGNELVYNMAEWKPGKIFDANMPMLLALFKGMGADVVMADHIPDDLDLTMEKITEALARCQVICFSGGVSAGTFDFIPRALKACGVTIHFDRVKIKPGKPMTFGTCGQAAILGFPGNPVSTYVMFHLFGVPTLAAFYQQNLRFRTIRMSSSGNFHRSKCDRLEFVPVIADNQGRIRPIQYHGSGHLAALCNIDGFMLVAAGVKDIPDGSSVDFWPVIFYPYREFTHD